MVEKEACINDLLERLGEIIVDVEEWSLHDGDFTLLYECLVNAQDEAESLRSD